MIYLIEDCLIDAEAIQRACTKCSLSDEILHFETGDAALAHLDDEIGNLKNSRNQLPRLIMLDLHLPGLDGKDVLRYLKTSEDFKAIPVLVLSSTTSAADVQKVYADGANAFLPKPVAFETLTEMLLYTKQFWFNVAIMPKNYH